jgi:VIT1/CCC1 family predicted Fe2+/Mn2+ transporter
MKPQTNTEMPEINPDTQENTDAGQEAAKQYAKRNAAAERKLGDGIKRLLSAKTLTKAGILEAVDLLPVYGPYTAADLYSAVDGVLDLTYALLHKELDMQERLTSGLRGVAKFTGAALPYAPAAAITPALDALLPTSRDEREKS